MPKKHDPCKHFACALADCLNKNNYQESSCKDVLEDFRQCCIKWKGDSFVCEGIKTDTPSKS